ncbi:DNA (cytosine-5)-methyltransferase 1 [Oceanobacillus limi]|uniref:Cytosine-specific methyltransferase n=1 Tax=Oceanobacillus limi TaxID=930131 RepID=A0A1H9Y083_9BACI|nr:DNA cytosine methyltransferase [Oceanobacillus limi]SES62012.1 DNA (cytosine-5)-methyltransferase 1 [Oceanobacillus limi]
MDRGFTFIDLFAGCGGFSEGFYMKGFKALAHIEIDKHACETLKERMRYYNYSEEEVENAVLCEDMTDPKVLTKLLNVVDDREVDLVVGGPPCQSFSSLGRAKDPNSMREDPRNFLFENYIDILNATMPKMFVFENVKGILNATINGRLVIDMIFDRMSENYDIVTDFDRILLNSAHYGVPQTRERVIIIGVRRDLNIQPNLIYDAIGKTHYHPEEEGTPSQQKYVTVAEAISDLPKLLPGEGNEESEFQPEKWNRYLVEVRKKDFTKLYNHRARGHNEKDMERYRLMSLNNWTLGELYEQVPELVHEKKRLFNNSYVVQRWDYPGKTIIAHLYKDGNQFIHPDHTQARTFTVREAARIQSFPDDFWFMGSRTQQYKQVGNAVPPLMARQIASTLKEYLIDIEKSKEKGKHVISAH